MSPDVHTGIDHVLYSKTQHFTVLCFNGNTFGSLFVKVSWTETTIWLTGNSNRVCVGRWCVCVCWRANLSRCVPRPPSDTRSMLHDPE